MGKRFCESCGATDKRFDTKTLCCSCYSRERQRKRRANMTQLERREEQLIQQVGKKAAKQFLHSDVCDLCGFKREGHYMQIHHINGDHSDNREGNHQPLCHYCHKEMHWNHSLSGSRGIPRNGTIR